MHLGSDHQHHWGVILAGGEGARLKSLTRFVSGEDTPKQFCRLLGGQSLLAQTTQRISRIICSERTVYVLVELARTFLQQGVAECAAPLIWWSNPAIVVRFPPYYRAF